MTSERDFKDLVRARMAVTGENYTTARSKLLVELDEAKRFRERTLRTFFPDGRLLSIPARRRARVVVLLELLRLFAPGRQYSELEVNDLLRPLHPDVALLRRELVDYGFVTRSAGVYRLADECPRPGSIVAGEFPADAAQRFAAAREAQPAHPAPSDD